MSKKEFLSPEYQEVNEAIEAELEPNESLLDEDYRSKWTNDDVKPGVSFDSAGAKWTGHYQGNDYKPSTDGFGTGYKPALYTPKCDHPPQLVIRDTDLELSFGKKWDCEDELDNFNVAVNLTGISVAKNHVIPIASLQKWAHYSKATEVILDWPDHGVLPFPLEFWEDLVKAVKDEGGKAVIFCIGGHGRTGTAMACLLISVLGFSAEEAKAWIWKNYCSKAIESKSQEDYIAEIWQQYRRKNKLKDRDKGKVQLLDAKK